MNQLELNSNMVSSYKTRNQSTTWRPFNINITLSIQQHRALFS